MDKSEYRNSNGEKVSLKEYFNTRILEQENQFNIKIAALEKATTIAAAQMEKRLESQNEFRGQLKDQAAGMFSRTEHEIYSQRVSDDIKELKDKTSVFLLRNEHDVYVKKMDEDIRVLRESKATLEGKASQMSVNVSLILAVISVIIAMVGMFRGFIVPVSSQGAAQTPQIIYSIPSTNWLHQ